MLKILTMGGGNYGFGHLGRCIPIHLAALSMRVSSCIIAANGGSTPISTSVDVIELDWLQDTDPPEITNEDTLIVDVLDISNAHLSNLKNQAKSLHIVDDVNIEKYQSFSRIDWSIKTYVLSNATSKLASPSLVPLRPSFSQFRKKVTRKTIDTILLTLGGSDVKSLTPTLIRFLRTNFPQISLVVLIGPGCTCVNEIKAVSDQKVTPLLRPSDVEIARAMENADLAVATGGHTMYELASAGLPTVQIQVVENQEVSKYWEHFGFSRFAGWYNDEHFYTRLKQAIKYFHPSPERAHASLLGQSIIDGKGAEKLIKEIMN